MRLTTTSYLTSSHDSGFKGVSTKCHRMDIYHTAGVGRKRLDYAISPHNIHSVRFDLLRMDSCIIEEEKTLRLQAGSISLIERKECLLSPNDLFGITA